MGEMKMPDLEIPNLTDSQKLYKGLVENLLTLNTAVNTVQDTVDQHDKILIRGNGEPPIRETVRNHDKFIAEIKYWMKFFIGLVIAQFVAFTTASIVAYIKFLPVLEQLAKKP